MYLSSFYLCFIIVLGIQHSRGQNVNSERPPYFRRDYTYIKEFNSFYKLHTVKQNWTEAVALCSAEGSQLIVPESKAEVDAIINSANDEFDYFWIGMHDMFSEGDFFTIDGSSASDVYTNWGLYEPNNKFGNENCVLFNRQGTYNDDQCHFIEFFVCKKSADDLKQNELCETSDSAYFYAIYTDRCYKLHKTPTTWRNAFRICRVEESHLAVINSETEANILKEALTRYPESNLKGNVTKDQIHVGFNDFIMQGTFMTIEGQRLADSGYEEWHPSQPDNFNGDERCGSMYRDGKLNDVNCESKAMFVCERKLADNKYQAITTMTQTDIRI